MKDPRRWLIQKVIAFLFSKKPTKKYTHPPQYDEHEWLTIGDDMYVYDWRKSA